MYGRPLTSTPLLPRALARQWSLPWFSSINSISGSAHSDLSTFRNRNKTKAWASTHSRRSLTNAALKTSIKSSIEVPSHRHQTLTLLHKTTAFISGILAKGLPTESVSTLNFWKGALSKVYNDMSIGETTGTKVRVACESLIQWIFIEDLIYGILNALVYGVDEWSGAQDVITALLEDPLASTEQQIESLRNRWESLPKGQESLVIE